MGSGTVTHTSIGPPLAGISPLTCTRREPGLRSTAQRVLLRTVRRPFCSSSASTRGTRSRMPRWPRRSPAAQQLAVVVEREGGYRRLVPPLLLFRGPVGVYDRAVEEAVLEVEVAGDAANAAAA